VFELYVESGGVGCGACCFGCVFGFCFVLVFGAAVVDRCFVWLGV